jgi:hypothetical protein
MDPGVDRDHVAEVYRNHGNSIRAQVVEALIQCHSEFPIDQMIKHMDYVCHHEGNTYNVRVNLEHGRWDEVRSIFSNAEKNDDRVRDVLYCYNASDVTTIEQKGCTP